MKFDINVARSYNFIGKKPPQSYIDLGFEFEQVVEGRWDITNEIKDYEIKTMEELDDFIKKHGAIVINEDNTLIIYNGYIE
jgi:hypothetical protein